jgi:hypothetical protein
MFQNLSSGYSSLDFSGARQSSWMMEGVKTQTQDLDAYVEAIKNSRKLAIEHLNKRLLRCATERERTLAKQTAKAQMEEMRKRLDRLYTSAERTQFECVQNMLKTTASENDDCLRADLMDALFRASNAFSVKHLRLWNARLSVIADEI